MTTTATRVLTTTAPVAVTTNSSTVPPVAMTTATVSTTVKSEGIYLASISYMLVLFECIATHRVYWSQLEIHCIYMYKNHAMTLTCEVLN